MKLNSLLEDSFLAFVIEEGELRDNSKHIVTVQGWQNNNIILRLTINKRGWQRDAVCVCDKLNKFNNDMNILAWGTPWCDEIKFIIEQTITTKDSYFFLWHQPHTKTIGWEFFVIFDWGHHLTENCGYHLLSLILARESDSVNISIITKKGSHNGSSKCKRKLNLARKS